MAKYPIQQIREKQHYSRATDAKRPARRAGTNDRTCSRGFGLRGAAARRNKNGWMLGCGYEEKYETRLELLSCLFFFLLVSRKSARADNFMGRADEERIGLLEGTNIQGGLLWTCFVPA
jgi:hypothetical protein